MKTPSKIITAVALAGLAVAGGAAFTAGGVTNDEPAEFIGGAVTQTITGAHVASITYTAADGDLTNTTVHQVVVVFVDDESDGKNVALVLGGGDAGVFAATTVNAGTNTATFTSSSQANDAANITSATITVS